MSTRSFWSICDEISRERARQIDKWGEQNHPDGTGDAFKVGDVTATMMADVARARCQKAANEGCVTWEHILAEEVCEAFAESGPDKLREELIQTAAVAVAWIEAIDRRSK
jgi:hypothetical protein